MRPLTNPKVIIDEIKKSIEEYQSQYPDPDEIIFLATETTGIDKDDEVIRLCVVDINKTIIIDTLFYTDKKIKPKATQINKLNNADLVGYPSFGDVEDIIIPFILSYRVWAYNTDFHIGKIKKTCTKKFDFSNMRGGCLMYAYGDRDLDEYWRFFYYFSEPLNKFDIPVPSPHDTKAKALACVDLFLELTK